MKNNGENNFFEKFENVAPMVLFVSVITLFLTVFGRMGYCYIKYPGEEMEIRMFVGPFKAILFTEFSIAMIIVTIIICTIAVRKLKKT